MQKWFNGTLQELKMNNGSFIRGRIAEQETAGIKHVLFNGTIRLNFRETRKFRSSYVARQSFLAKSHILNFVKPSVQPVLRIARAALP